MSPAGIETITMSPGELDTYLIAFTFNAGIVSKLVAVVATPTLPDFMTFGFNAADVVSATRVQVRIRLIASDDAFGGVFPSSIKYDFVDLFGSTVVSVTKEFDLVIDAPPPPDDHGDDCENATPLSPTSATPGFLAPGDSDFFRLDIEEEGTLTSSTISMINTLGTVYNELCEPVAMDDDGGTDENFRILQGLSPGTHFLSVSGATPGTYGDYLLNLEYVLSDPFVNFTYLPQFVDGTGFTSRLQIFAGDEPTQVKFEIRGDTGEFLNRGFGAPDGAFPFGDSEEVFEVPAQGLGIFETAGVENLVAGSLTVISSEPLAGASLVFGGEFGLAGVDPSTAVDGTVRIPIQRVLEALYNTGVAIQNLEESEIELQVRLLDKESNQLSTAAALEIPALGHTSLFVDDFVWQDEIDFSNFEGILEILSNGDQFAATALLSRPGQFASLRVVVQQGGN